MNGPSKASMTEGSVECIVSAHLIQKFLSHIFSQLKCHFNLILLDCYTYPILDKYFMSITKGGFNNRRIRFEYLIWFEISFYQELISKIYVSPQRWTMSGKVL